MTEEQTFLVAVPSLELVEEVEAPSAGDAVHRVLESSSGAFEEKTEKLPFGELFGSTARPIVAWVICPHDVVTRFQLELAWKME